MTAVLLDLKLFDVYPIASAICLHGGQITQANRALEQLTGRPLERLVGSTLHSLAADDAGIDEALAHHVQHGKAEARFPMVDREGRTRAVFMQLVRVPGSLEICCTLDPQSDHGVVGTSQGLRPMPLADDESWNEQAYFGSFEADLRTKFVRFDAVAASLHGLERFPVGLAFDAWVALVRAKDSGELCSSFARLARGEERSLQRSYWTIGGRWLEVRGPVSVIDDSHLPRRIHGIVLDVTDAGRRQAVLASRLRMKSLAEKQTRAQVLQSCIDEAERLTGSAIGFLHSYESGRRSINLEAWSDNTLRHACRVRRAGMRYDLDEAGVWGDCIRLGTPVIHNDYPALVHKKGLPDGHAPVVRELVVPVFREDRIVAILGVGNKTTDYDQLDLEVVNELADAAVDVVTRKQAEEELVASERRFRELTKYTPIAYQSLNAAGQILDVNEYWCELLGFSRSEVLGRMYADLCVGDSKRLFLTKFPEFLEQGVVGPIDFELSAKQGSMVSVTVSGRVQRYADGSVRTHCFIQDITERKRVEDQQRRFFDLSPDIFCIANQTHFLQVNGAAERVLGYSAKELLEVPFPDLIHPDDADETRTRVAASFEHSSREPGFTNRYLAKDGRLRWIEWTAQPVPEEGVSFAVGRDVTKRIAMDQALAERERSYRLIVENQTELILEIDAKGRFTYISPSFCDVFALRLDDVVGAPFESIIPLDLLDRRGLKPLLVELRQPPNAALREVELETVRGRRWFSASVKVVDIEVDKRFLIVARDITDQKRDQQALQRIITAVEASREAIGLSNAQGQHFYQNPAFTELFGFSVDDLAALGGPKHLYCDRQVADEVFASIQDGRSWMGVASMRSKSGRAFPVEVRADAVKGDDGQVIALVGLHQDITERRKAEKSLLEAKAAAERAASAKTEFLANMSHEIRTPMNAIVGANHLLRRTGLTARQLDFVDKQDAALRTLTGIIDDVLDMSKIDAGRLTLERTAFNVRELVQDLMAIIEMAVQEKHLEIVLDTAADLPTTVFGDSLRVRQVLLNLLSNAVRFTSAGSVALKVERQVREGNENWLCFTVTDTGCGIPESHRARVFDAFCQVDESTTRRYGGTGLGLTISTSLAALMHGELDVESQEGVGSSFTFAAPFELAPTLDSPPQAEKSTAVQDHASGKSDRLRGATVLVVDDNDINRELLRDLLKEEGAHADLATDGAQAVQNVMDSRRSYDVVLMDLQMPGIDGYEAIRRIRARRPDGKPTVIAITADVVGDVRDRVLAAGADAYVGKPFSPVELMDLISAHMHRKPSQNAPWRPSTNHAGIGMKIDGVDTESGLIRWGSNERTYRRALGKFALEYAPLAQSLRDALDREELNEAIRLAHRIKGVAGTLAVTNVFELATRIHEVLRRRDVPPRALLDELDQAFAYAIAGIRAAGCVNEPEPNLS